jgi:hypothetical protein
MPRNVVIGFLISWMWIGLATAEPAPVSARQAMQHLFDRLSSKNMQAAREFCVSADEWAALSRRTIDKKEYKERLDKFLGQFERDLSAGLTLGEAKTADALILPAGKKTREEKVMVVIYASFLVKGKALEGPPMPFFFINIQGKWKMFMRK